MRSRSARESWSGREKALETVLADTPSSSAMRWRVGRPRAAGMTSWWRTSTMKKPVAILCLVQFTDVLGVTVVVTALPAILADLQAPASAAALVSTGYAMCFGGLLM